MCYWRQNVSGPVFLVRRSRWIVWVKLCLSGGTRRSQSPVMSAEGRLWTSLRTLTPTVLNPVTGDQRRRRAYCIRSNWRSSKAAPILGVSSFYSLRCVWVEFNLNTTVILLIVHLLISEFWLLANTISTKIQHRIIFLSPIFLFVPFCFPVVEIFQWKTVNRFTIMSVMWWYHPTLHTQRPFAACNASPRSAKRSQFLNRRRCHRRRRRCLRCRRLAPGSKYRCLARTPPSGSTSRCCSSNALASKSKTMSFWIEPDTSLTDRI